MEQLIKNEIKKIIDRKKVCPANIKELNKIINLKNQLTKQLNNIYSKVESINNILNPITEIIPKTKTGIQIAQTAIDAISFIPSTLATPIPVGPILQGQKAIKILRSLIGKGEGKITQGTSQLSFLLNKLQTVIDLLEIVDLAINSCAEELGGDLEEQEQITQELLDSTNQQEQQLSPVINSFNGFDLSVVAVEGSTVGTLKRRQAIATNPQGIIMLRGEPSFSSNDQILIDQLAFSLKQNNLKAD